MPGRGQDVDSIGEPHGKVARKSDGELSAKREW